ncbi:hypothetical protein CANARDRAFT_21858 [[Candida] arabinofermentans NRRL YB-2248]|uniref:Zn(2)-C6 fungal-type domain-containing protein n=1 Tax=[Candida] arabinofermentans NRRL YB-2248 TaxID=983967 RepID=A0A1E4T555_9ASCO|nr:hypothetical protein CANARDRAFT_21858 [[Candida] arabinofermentans NRRL YB-2248]
MSSPKLHKRRIVSSENRKRALFSCDRCKLRKTKCKRLLDNDLRYDNITPCIQCSKANVSCTTSIPRKKRVYGPIENITLHYKCLLTIVTGLFPNLDVYNIDELIDFGKSYKFDMPSIDSNDDIQELNESITKEDEPAPDIKPKSPEDIKMNSYDNERLIMDRFGHTHFIGNYGTASLLNGLCDIIIKKSYNLKPPTSTQDIRDSSVQTITSENEPIYQYPTHLYNLDKININRFPLINLLKRQEADLYVKVFFEKIHPYYFIFNEGKFLKKYSIFWDEINSKDTETNQMKITSFEICCIYMIWILGCRFNPNDLPSNAELNNELVSRYIDIIKLSLSDTVLTPNIDGIRLLILLSVYLSSIKVRESGFCLMQLAAIQCKSLGLHRKLIVNKFNIEKSDEMKRIMWSLTKSETTLCCSFGRASVIPWEEIDIDLPKLNDNDDELFKIYYFQSCNLTKIIFQILDNKKKSQKEPLSLTSIEKSLIFQKNLEQFWENLPFDWKNYKSSPIKRYKPKLHIQYHYYFITLTLPMFLHIVNTKNFTIKKDDPIMSLLINGIKSSIKTAEIVTYTDSNGFFNGTLYYDVFYSYNAIMVLTLSYILFKSSSPKSTIDLNYLNEKHQINLNAIFKAINLIRKLILNNLFKIDGTMRRISDIIETLLEDLGIIHVLVKDYNATPSNVRKIEDKNESGKTSVNGSIPGYYRKLRMNISENKKRKMKSDTPVKKKVHLPESNLMGTQSIPDQSTFTARNYSTLFQNFGQEQIIQDQQNQQDPIFQQQQQQQEGDFLQSESIQLQQHYTQQQYNQDTMNLQVERENENSNISATATATADNNNRSSSSTPMSSISTNEALNSILDTELIDVLFGEDLLNGVVNNNSQGEGGEGGEGEGEGGSYSDNW